MTLRNGVARSVAKLQSLRGWSRLAASFLAGVSGALAMAPIYALPLLVVAFSGLILLLDACDGRHSRRSAFAIGWFFAFGYFLAGIYWMAFSFFVQAEEFAWMAPFAMTGLPGFLALFGGVAAVIYSSCNHSGWRRILFFVAIWAILEFMRGHVLTGLPWNLAGQSLAGSALLAQSAAWYGAYGLSFVAVLLSSAPAAGLGERCGGTRAAHGLAACLIGFALLAAVGAVRLAAPEPAPSGTEIVRIVQPNIPQREKIDPDFWGRNFERQLSLSTGGAPADAALYVIWPENGAPLLNEASTALRVLQEALPSNAVLLAGAVRRQAADDGFYQYYNSLMLVPEVGGERRVVGAYDKHHLVPFGEYLPFYDLLNLIGLAQLTPYGDAGFSKGEGPAVLSLGGAPFAPMICYEAIFPRRSYPAGERPRWLVTVTNDAWFGDTSGPRQHLDQARLRSIEAGLPMARAANTGISALIDGKGRILSRIPLYRDGRIEATLPPALNRTLYDRVGDWIFLLMCAAALASSLLNPRKS